MGQIIRNYVCYAGAKAIIFGYNDPKGNVAANAELSKNRAKGVATALCNAEARRVEVTIRK